MPFPCGAHARVGCACNVRRNARSIQLGRGQLASHVRFMTRACEAASPYFLVAQALHQEIFTLLANAVSFDHKTCQWQFPVTDILMKVEDSVKAFRDSSCKGE